MNAILICPAERDSVSKLAESAPFATLPILGQSLLEYWLEHLTSLGATHVRILAADRPEQVRAHVGNGARWGLRVEVLPEIRELTVAEARKKYYALQKGDWIAQPHDIVFLDRLPGLPAHCLLESYEAWYTGVLSWFLHTPSPLPIGIHEVQPGVWAGLRTKIAPSAKLHAPCWLGHHVWIGPNAVVGPMAVVENNAFVESGATVSHSVVGPETFVGELTDVKDSIALGNMLLNWRSGLSLEVDNPLLLCGLRQRAPLKRPNWLARLAALWLMLATLPAAACVMWRSKQRGRPAFRHKVAVLPDSRPGLHLEERLVYYELASVNRWLRRWPQLWNVARGEFSWVGNRPLSPHDASSLRNESEWLWLASPIGLISLADAATCAEAFSDEARAHASFYAVKANWRLDCSIFARALAVSLFGKQPTPGAEVLSPHYSATAGERRQLS